MDQFVRGGGLEAPFRIDPAVDHGRGPGGAANSIHGLEEQLHRGDAAGFVAESPDRLSLQPRDPGEIATVSMSEHRSEEAEIVIAADRLDIDARGLEATDQ